VAEQLAASQEGLSSIQLVSYECRDYIASDGRASDVIGRDLEGRVPAFAWRG
jgi:hypothetical protein